MHDAPMTGRLLAVCGWLAWQVGRPFGHTPLRRRRWPAMVLAAMLVVLSAVPIVLPMLEPQPQDVTVQEVMDGAVTEPDRWIRLRGRLVELQQRPAPGSGRYGLLVDQENTLRAIVVRSRARLPDDPDTMLTGHVVEDAVTVDEETLPIEATVFGTPPQIVGDRLVELDETATPVRVVPWPVSIAPALLAVVLIAGARAGYPIFRPTTEVDVLSAPLGPGERVPAAYGGRVGDNLRDLADPGGALLLVRRAEAGNVLNVQPLSDDGRPAPAPVTVGGGWSTGRLGYVHTVSETVPALRIRSELVDATFLFARVGERDRAATLVSVER